MQGIDLKLIQSSPNPVRKTWDEDKMNELAASIAEQGVIVPVKVRPLGTGYGYELVYGHRRAEAARRANLESIPAIVEGVDDTDALIQALIENIQREDMGAVDLSRAVNELRRVKDWTWLEAARALGWTREHTQRVGAIVNDDPEVVSAMSGEAISKSLPLQHHNAAKPVQGKDRAAVLRKAGAEELSQRATRAVAESVAAAPSEEARNQLLREPYSPNLHDPEMIRDRASRYGAADPMWSKPATIDRVSVTDSPEARAILDLVKRWRDQMRAAQQSINAGKLSPEACRFLASRVSKFASELAAWSDELEVAE